MTMKPTITLVFALLLAPLAALHADDTPPPNILWISLEDINPMLGCYGDSYARTPNIDSLAESAIRYSNAHAPGVVCSPTRTAVITGMYPSSIGAMHHRSMVKPPEFLRMFPHYLRQAGYFTGNVAKMDYNLPMTPAGMWDARGARAHWRNRPKRDQPFFTVFNFTECHSSVLHTPDEKLRDRLGRLRESDFHDPDEVRLPPYHPDIPEFREAWARYYDSVTQVDYRVGDLIKQLKEDGLWDTTIIFAWSDHGNGILRGKQWVWEQGTHVPLIVRFPAKYQHLAPTKPGSVIDDPVTLLDLGPSVLRLAGVEISDYMEGRPTLCRGGKPREFVIGQRDRMDTRFELIRTVRDGRWRYHRNFYPHVPYFGYENYIYQAEYVRKWDQLARHGKLTGPQAQLAALTKPMEELYDSRTDPHMVNNLAGDPRHAGRLERMRGQLYRVMVETRDLGLLDEPEMLARAGERPPWEVGRELKNYERILETADLHRTGDLNELLARTSDPDSAVRFWAVTGLVILEDESDSIRNVLKKAAVDDVSVSVRIAAADGLLRLGEAELAAPVFKKAMQHPLDIARARAATALDSMPPSEGPRYRSLIEPLQKAMAGYTRKGWDWQYWYPMERAIKVINGDTTFYRWSER
tara:strand:+ start:455 stop:2362 length:1908 start_codon:yes stop_codon:yes gene_type:complete